MSVLLQKPLALMIIINIIFNQLLALVIIIIINMIRQGIIFFRKKVLGKDTPVRIDILELPEAKKQTAGSSCLNS